MDENASRAVFLGVSVFVAVITITLIVNFYSVAKETGAAANRYDMTEGNANLEEILEKEKISGIDLRYLLNFYVGKEEYSIKVYHPDEDETTDDEIKISSKDYWNVNNQQKLDEKIRPNYTYVLKIIDNNKIVATLEK